MRTTVAAAAALLLLAACGAEQDRADAGAPVEAFPTSSAASSARSSTEPSETPTSSSTPTWAAEPPTTTVPAEVMLTSGRERFVDRSRVEPWRGGWCTPDPGTPTAASAMRTRAWRGPTDPDTGPLEYAQQVAAFPTVHEAVAEADKLVTAADTCTEARSAAGPKVTELPLGTQGRLITFAEGGDYMIRGFFRRANAVASVQGRGDSEDEVRDALNTSFTRLCIYERPRAC